MKNSVRRLVISGLAASALVSLPMAANAYGSYDGGGSYGGGGSNGRAVSYINGDGGVNPDVNADASCTKPDQSDKQAFSDPGTANRNVHNDACFVDNGVKVDGPASFESSGVGVISACPDPDGTGPKVAVFSSDKKLCFQTGYQEKGIAGDREFHARLNNNTATPGTQYVTWCSDTNRNGCSDEWNKSSIRIDWSADGMATYSNDTRSYSGGTGW